MANSQPLKFYMLVDAANYVFDQNFDLKRKKTRKEIKKKKHKENKSRKTMLELDDEILEYLLKY